MALNLQKETVVKLVEKLEEVKGGNADRRNGREADRSFGSLSNK